LKRIKEKEETVIEPELRICDAHHHLWDYADNRYLTQDFLQDIGRQKVVKTVCVEAWGRNQRSSNPFKTPAEQTAFTAADSAKKQGDTQIAAGIVGYTDLMQGDGIARDIEAHIAAGQGEFRGIRVAAESLFDSPKFVAGFRHVIKPQIAVEVVFIDRQLNRLKSLAHRYPEVPIVINHLGMATTRAPGYNLETDNIADKLRLWQKVIGSLGECPNLFMKLGGLGMDLEGAGWNNSAKPGSVGLAAIMKLWFTPCVEKFGPGRCMLESNFPVDKKSFSYTAYWNAAKIFSKSYSISEREALFFGTAAKVYRLN
jgi:L-fuconolactonase